ncbi:DegT/DnrJ/EryC1/StrS family aminotransferase [Lysobacter sp. 5GHs7-4]|uniref:DegT/DnrJ/EryC1/StrS family aminotransferase n=1 Tax=Lysobacter sp. 5GHs7-4 TaxID=2904253 RepID=UPI001E2C70F8|nr:DegT/DnrJ/EryC1/StrS family aminotransferase [Lysobacter sp. 5GHs7-4]UHQ22664.1 DegT/DnrJ/EryC1/StrS family aminotransferase [Lysobacter sp. 5GHs7-4]
MTSHSIPINSLLRHIEPLQAALAQAANDVIGSGHFVLGRRVAAFEAEFAAYCGSGHCIGVANGTDALELALKGMGVAPGDRVIVAANAAMYATSAVLACGAEPVFADILPDEATLDPAAVEAVLRTQPAAKALVATHLYGRLARMRELLALCRAHGVAVVEDCAQAHGARDADGVRAGALGDIASFSFYPTKNLGALGDGGAVVCGDDALAARVRQLRQYGWTGKYTNALAGGRNSRLDEIQAAMLSAMLPLLDGWNRRRRAIANRYSEQIRNASIATSPVAGDDYVAHLYVIRSDRRDELREHLAAAGVQTDIHYPTPDHRQPCHGGRYADIDLPHTQRDAARVLTLPCFPEMTDDEVAGVIQACNRF